MRVQIHPPPKITLHPILQKKENKQKTCLEMQSYLREELRKEKKNKNVVFTELEEWFHTKDVVKRNIKRFKDADVDGVDSAGDTYTESQ